jgi:hypothetical protein
MKPRLTDASIHRSRTSTIQRLPASIFASRPGSVTNMGGLVVTMTSYFFRLSSAQAAACSAKIM